MNENQLDDALYALPLAEVPAGFSKAVLGRIKPQRRHASLQFRLTWADYALGIFLSLLPIIGFVAYTSLPRKTILYLQYYLLVLQSPVYEPVFFSLLAAAGMLALLFFALGVRYILPRQMSLF